MSCTDPGDLERRSLLTSESSGRPITHLEAELLWPRVLWTQASGALKTGLQSLALSLGLPLRAPESGKVFPGRGFQLEIRCFSGHCTERVDAQSTGAELFNSSPDLMISWLRMLRVGLRLQAPDLSDALWGTCMAMVAGISVPGLRHD